MTTTFKNIWLGAGVALIALVSLALPTTFVQADFGDDIGVWDGGYESSPDTYYESSPDTYYESSPDTYYESSPDTYDYDYSYDYDYNDDYAYQDDYGYGSNSYGGSGSGFSMPSFGGGSSYGGYSYGGSSYYQDYPSYSTPKSKSNSYSYTNLEYCKNNSCNTYTDNSIKVNNSFNNQKKAINDCYDNSYGYGYNQGYNYGDGYDQAYGYGQQGYNYGTYNYDGHCYAYSAPIAYNTTPYISLSQTPYTGLDLGPFGEVLYWTFLVLWCLGAAYLIVVKRVQNSLVSFLNGFLFGGAASKGAHTTHAPAHTHTVAASAPLVEEGIDPFIQSQIKRS